MTSARADGSGGRVCGSPWGCPCARPAFGDPRWEFSWGASASAPWCLLRLLSFPSPYHPNVCTVSRALLLLAGLHGGGSHRNTTSDLPGLQTNEKFISSC